MRKSGRPFTGLLAGAAILLALPACRLDLGSSPASGFAVISGTLRQSDGTPWAPANVFFMCGETGADRFGWAVPVRTGGAFRIEVDAPGVRRPDDGNPSFILRCRVSAPVQNPAALRYGPVTFTRAKRDRQVTSFELVNGQKDSIPSGWTESLSRRTSEQ